MNGLLRIPIALIGPALILVGFGLTEWERFLAEPARPALVVVLFIGRIAMGGAYRFKIQVQSEAKAQVLLPVTVISLTLAAMLGLPWLDAHPGTAPWLRLELPALRWVGVALFGAGIGIQAWSTITLGRWFSPRIAIQEDHELITEGPYRWVRHPFYTGLLACVLGFPAVFASWIGLPACALTFGIVLYRVRVEEGLLEDAFGDDYRELKTRTTRLIPWVI